MPNDTISSKSREVQVGYSPCPNDTFIFYPLVSGAVPCADILWRPELADVETLNHLATCCRYPVTKISFHAFAYLRASYVLLNSGSALGRGCGPLLVARSPKVGARLEQARIATPGHLTSAALLLRLYAPQLPKENIVESSFDRIFDSIEQGEVDAGLIIHETRFTYQDRGLVALVDLGEWWEETTGQPIPLGGIIADRRLGSERLSAIDNSLRASVVYARSYPEFCAEYVRQHAQEMEASVTQAHIDLYVNEHTENLGDEGIAAVEALFREGAARGVLPAYDGDFVRRD